MHLSYSYYQADMDGFVGHAQKVFKVLGITYSHCVGQSIGDCFWFFNCKNIPDELPDCITELKGVNPYDWYTPKLSWVARCVKAAIYSSKNNH